MIVEERFAGIAVEEAELWFLFPFPFPFPSPSPSIAMLI